MLYDSLREKLWCCPTRRRLPGARRRLGVRQEPLDRAESTIGSRSGRTRAATDDRRGRSSPWSPRASRRRRHTPARGGGERVDREFVELAPAMALDAVLAAARRATVRWCSTRATGRVRRRAAGRRGQRRPRRPLHRVRGMVVTPDDDIVVVAPARPRPTRPVCAWPASVSTTSSASSTTSAGGSRTIPRWSRTHPA